MQCRPGKTDKRAGPLRFGIIRHYCTIERERTQKFAKNAKGESKMEYFAKTI